MGAFYMQDPPVRKSTSKNKDVKDNTKGEKSTTVIRKKKNNEIPHKSVVPKKLKINMLSKEQSALHLQGSDHFIPNDESSTSLLHEMPPNQIRSKEKLQLQD